jgi:hypothetical protein
MPVRKRNDRQSEDARLGEQLLTLESLPPPNTSRWVARRKAQVATAVQNGLLSVDEACRRYRLTLEELAGWQRALRQFGVRGLQATRMTRRPESPWIGRHA